MRGLQGVIGRGEVHWVPVRPRPRQMTSRGTVLLLVLIVSEFLLCFRFPKFNNTRAKRK